MYKSNKQSTKILGMTTVNDKGQVVIPADARQDISLQPGDKLIVMTHPSKEGIILIKPDGLEKYANQMLEQLSIVKNNTKGE